MAVMMIAVIQEVFIYLCCQIERLVYLFCNALRCM